VGSFKKRRGNQKKTTPEEKEGGKDPTAVLHKSYRDERRTSGCYAKKKWNKGAIRLCKREREKEKKGENDTSEVRRRDRG